MAHVTAIDLKRFASIGYPAMLGSEMPDGSEPEPGLLFESVVNVMAEPSARLVTAAALALSVLALRNQLPDDQVDELSDDVRRRLGYVAERLLADPHMESSDTLSRFLERLVESRFRDEPPITLGLVQDAYLRKKLESADEVNERWQVYGNPEFRYLDRAS